MDCPSVLIAEAGSITEQMQISVSNIISYVNPRRFPINLKAFVWFRLVAWESDYDKTIALSVDMVNSNGQRVMNMWSKTHTVPRADTPMIYMDQFFELRDCQISEAGVYEIFVYVNDEQKAVYPILVHDIKR